MVCRRSSGRVQTKTQRPLSFPPTHYLISAHCIVIYVWTTVPAKSPTKTTLDDSTPLKLEPLREQTDSEYELKCANLLFVCLDSQSSPSETNQLNLKCKILFNDVMQSATCVWLDVFAKMMPVRYHNSVGISSQIISSKMSSDKKVIWIWSGFKNPFDYMDLFSIFALYISPIYFPVCQMPWQEPSLFEDLHNGEKQMSSHLEIVKLSFGSRNQFQSRWQI